ncbi:hypothetical protein ACQP3L_32930, partial [Escherichia coli]
PVSKNKTKQNKTRPWAPSSAFLLTPKKKWLLSSSGTILEWGLAYVCQAPCCQALPIHGEA